MDRETLDTTFVLAAIIVIAIGYVLPSIVAFHRRHPNRRVIAVINIAFGVPVIGWDIVLAWAFGAADLSKDDSSGCESDPFVNDAKKAELVNADRPAWSGLSEGLNDLREQGAITDAEFETLKVRFLPRN